MNKEKHKSSDTTTILLLMNQMGDQLAEVIKLVKENSKRIDEMGTKSLGQDQRLSNLEFRCESQGPED